MVKTRCIAYRLAATTAISTAATAEDKDKRKCAFLEVSQKRKSISNPTEDTVKGPIRLRLLHQLPTPRLDENGDKDLGR